MKNDSLNATQETIQEQALPVQTGSVRYRLGEWQGKDSIQTAGSNGYWFATAGTIYDDEAAAELVRRANAYDALVAALDEFLHPDNKNADCGGAKCGCQNCTNARTLLTSLNVEVQK